MTTTPNNALKTAIGLLLLDLMKDQKVALKQCSDFNEMIYLYWTIHCLPFMDNSKNKVRLRNRK